MENCVCKCPETFYAYNGIAAISEFRRNVIFYDAQLVKVTQGFVSANELQRSNIMKAIINRFRKVVGLAEERMNVNKLNKLVVKAESRNVVRLMIESLNHVMMEAAGPKERLQLQGWAYEIYARVEAFSDKMMRLTS